MIVRVTSYEYDNNTEKIDAHGRPLPRELEHRGYSQVNDVSGHPLWYVRPCRVWVYAEAGGTSCKFDIYSNIMALYPERKRISKQLVDKVMEQINRGYIKIILDAKGEPYLFVK